MGIIGRTLDTGQATACLDAIQEHPGPLSSAAHRLQAGLKDSLQQLPRVVRGHVETHRARAELKRIEKEARRRLAEHEAYKRLQVEQEMQAAFETRFECLSCPHKEKCPRHGPYVQHYNNIPLNAFSPKGSPFINYAAACSATPRQTAADQPDSERRKSSSKRGGDRGGTAAPEKGSSATYTSVTKLSNGADALQALTAAIGNMRTVNKGDEGFVTSLPNSACAVASSGSNSNSNSHDRQRHVSYFSSSSSSSSSMLSASSSSSSGSSSSSSPQAPSLQQGSSFFSAFSTPAAAPVSASLAAAAAAANTTKTALPAACNSAAAHAVAAAAGVAGGAAGAAAAVPASDGASVAFNYKMPLPSSPCAGGIPVGRNHGKFLSPRDTAGSGSSSSAMTVASTSSQAAAGIIAAAAATLAAQRVEQMVAAVADPTAGAATPLPTAVLIQAGNKACVKAANKAIRCVRRSKSVPGSPITTAHQQTTTSSCPAAAASVCRLSRGVVTALNLSWQMVNGVAGDAGVDSVSTCAVLNTARSEGGCAKVDEATWANMMTQHVTLQESTPVSPQAQQPQQQQQDKASLTKEQLQERARELRQQRAKQQMQQAREQLQQARQQLQQAKEEVQLRTPQLPPCRLNQLDNQKQEEQQTDKEQEQQERETQLTVAPALHTCRSHNTTSTGASSSRQTSSPAAPQMTAAAAAIYASVADTLEVALQHGNAAAAKLAAQKQAAAAAAVAARAALSPQRSGVVRGRKNDRLDTWAAELVDHMVASNRLPPYVPGARKRLMLVCVRRPHMPQQQQQQQQQQGGPWKKLCRWLERRLTREGRLLASLHAGVDKL